MDDISLDIPYPQGFCVGVTEAVQLPPWLARAAPVPGREGSLRRGDGGQHREHLHHQVAPLVVEVDDASKPGPI